MKYRLAGFIGGILREPFVHFLFLGAALFTVSYCLSGRGGTTRIEVTKEQVRRIAEDYRVQHGTLPTAKQLDDLVDHFVDDEIFYREALRLGLDKEDEVVRQRMVQKFSFLQLNVAVPEEPSDADLLRYYRDHLDKYRAADGLTFNEVRADVRRDYLQAETSQHNAESRTKLHEHYIIVRQ